MTNTEAKKILEAYIACESKKAHFECDDYNCDDNCPLLYEMGTVGEHNEAINMAIQALEQEPCEDAISKRAVNILVDELARAISDERCCMSRGRSTATIMQDILDLSSVKPQERTGHWNLFHTTEHGMREDSYFKCNRCNYESYKEYNFCPDCGAKMVEPQEREE